MIRGLLRGRTSVPGPFRLRGEEITRLEGFSDAVFGFAVTLLVVSLEVPTDFTGLLDNLRNLLPFAICFGLLCYLWYRHYLYFRRYGLQDGMTVALNALLLFVILAYVYPLKFLFRSWLGSGSAIASLHEETQLYIIYGLGWFAVYAVFALLYLHAWRLRKRLDLNAEERYETLASLYDNLAMASIGLLSGLLAFATPLLQIGAPGLIYFSVAIVQTVVGTVVGRRRRMEQKLQPSAKPATGTS